MKKIKVAIIGTGNIGTDLLIKTFRSKYLNAVSSQAEAFYHQDLKSFKNK